MHKLLKLSLIVAFLMGVSMANAVEMLEYLTDAEGRYDGPTVEDNIAKMDTDNNGFADVYEVRAFLEKKHGEGYQKTILGRWEVKASSKSCGTSIIDEFIE
jgi:hypothetical protein